MSSSSSKESDYTQKKSLVKLLPCGSLTDVSSFIYRESNLDEFGKPLHPSLTEDSLPHSLYPPESWPSGEDLAKESDAYPAPTPPETSEISLSTHSSSKILKSIPVIPTVEKPAPKWYDELFVLKQCIDQKKNIKTSGTTKTISQDHLEEAVEAKEEELNDSFDLLKDQIALPVTDECYIKLCFPESLIINSVIDPKEMDHKTLINYKNLQEVGGLTINVETCYNNNFLVFMATQFSYDLKNYSGCKTSLMTILDSNLVTIEEKKTEQLCMKNQTNEKTLHIVKRLKENNYKLSMKKVHNNQIKRNARWLTVDNEKKNFILDGGCLVLMRYLILIDFVGEIKFNSVHINGTLNVIKIRKKNEKIYRISCKKYLLIKIKHICVNPHSKPIVTIYYFLKSTLQIIFIKWPNLNIQITINKLKLKVDGQSEYNIDNDLLLLSQYIDNKSKNKLLINDYLHTNYNVKNLIKDYILCLLQLKPKNILQFTMDHFVNISQQKNI